MRCHNAVSYVIDHIGSKITYHILERPWVWHCRGTRYDSGHDTTAGAGAREQARDQTRARYAMARRTRTGLTDAENQ